MFHEYSPADVAVSFNGLPITGFAPDTFIRLRRNTDVFGETVGSEGELALTVIPDKTGEIEITLMQTAPSNFDLSAALKLQEETRVPTIGVLMIQDPSGSVLAIAKNAYFKAYPEVELGSDQNSKTWMFGCEQLEYTSTPPGFVPRLF